ncbi:MAG: hypothetical protein ACI8ZN_001170 [Bacteroidia bacterium]|jgi:hypothetical protein
MTIWVGAARTKLHVLDQDIRLWRIVLGPITESFAKGEYALQSSFGTFSKKHETKFRYNNLFCCSLGLVPPYNWHLLFEGQKVNQNPLFAKGALPTHSLA